MLKYFTIFILLACLLTGCKKDQLQFSAVQQLNSHTTTDRFNRILFINDSIGFVVGGLRTSKATILTTHDGGRTWAYTNYTQAGTGIYGITLAPSGWLYTIGYNGKLLLSKDNGATWSFNQLYHWEMTDIAFAAAGYGTLVGGINFSGGYLIKVKAGGIYDTQFYYQYQLNRVKMSGNTGYIGGYGIFQKTTDGGQTWQVLSIHNDDFMGIDLHDNGNTIWVCGYNGCIHHSTDAGANWEELRNGNDITSAHYHLLDILFKDPQHGYACGENGLLVYTDDGGHHWSQYTHFTDNALRSMALRPDGRLIVAGDAGALYSLSF